jgi:hypothetical protein
VKVKSGKAAATEVDRVKIEIRAAKGHANVVPAVHHETDGTLTFEFDSEHVAGVTVSEAKATSSETEEG